MSKVTTITATMTTLALAALVGCTEGEKAPEVPNPPKVETITNNVKDNVKEIESHMDNENNSAEKLYAEALTYLNGEQKDPVKAFSLIKEVADTGYAKAQANLALLCAAGIGTEKDLTKAFELYTLAAVQGDATAQRFLGTYYTIGIGTSKDLSKAFEWTKRAADQADPQALYNLSVLYTKGLGTEVNEIEALGCLRKAADAGDANAQLDLGVRLLKEDEAANAEESFKYMKLAAEQGKAQALFNLGVYYDRAIGIEKNNKAAINCFIQAANRGHKQAIEIMNKLAAQAKAAEAAKAAATTDGVVTPTPPTIVD